MLFFCVLFIVIGNPDNGVHNGATHIKRLCQGSIMGQHTLSYYVRNPWYGDMHKDIRDPKWDRPYIKGYPW